MAVSLGNRGLIESSRSVLSNISICSNPVVLIKASLAVMDSFNWEKKRPVPPIGHLRRRTGNGPFGSTRALVPPQTVAVGYGLAGQSFIHGQEKSGQDFSIVETHNQGSARDDNGSLGLVNLTLFLDSEVEAGETHPKESSVPANFPCWAKPDAFKSCELVGDCDYRKALLSKAEQAYMMSQILNQRRLIQAGYGYGMDQFQRRTTGLFGPKQWPPTVGSSRSYVSIEECFFCKTHGEDKAMYRSHRMRSPCTKEIICPLLTANMCLICGDNGGFDVHTVKDCTNQLRAPGNGRF